MFVHHQTVGIYVSFQRKRQETKLNSSRCSFHFSIFFFLFGPPHLRFSPRLICVFLACSPCGEHRTNIGLNLKFNKKNEEVPGYTKRTEKEWLYSAAVEEVLAEYVDRSTSCLRILICFHLLFLFLF